MTIDDFKSHKEEKFEEEPENGAIKREDFVESHVKTYVMYNEAVKLKKIEEPENGAIKREDFVESHVKTDAVDNQAVKLKKNEEEPENGAIKREDFVESHVRTDAVDNQAVKLKKNEEEPENGAIKGDDFVESDVKTDVIDEAFKLKSEGVLKLKITAEGMENEEVSFVKSMLNDGIPEEKTAKCVKTEDKNLEKNNDHWMQRSSARSLRKLKYVNTALENVTVSEVDDKKVGRVKRSYNRKAKEDGSKLKEKKIEKPNEEASGPSSTKITSKNKPREKSTTKQKIRDEIKCILLNAGWRIDLRPRNGRDYNDSVYIPPTGGGGYWSITKAYNVYLKVNAESTCALVPPDQVHMLTRVVVNKRGSGKSKTSEKNKQGLTIRKVKNEGVKARKKRAGTSARDGKQAEEEEDDGYEEYFWKRSILSWMIDMGVVKVNEKVNYMNQEKNGALQVGSITRDGILCGCCNKTVSVVNFEIHAGSKINQPYQNIVLEKKGVSLLDCQINAWEKQKESERQDFYQVDLGWDDHSDDACGICGDGGDLVCCDECPSTFHLSCLGLEMLPLEDWHCTNCLCRYCLDLEEDDPSELLTCRQCERKYHRKCIPYEESLAVCSNNADASFCGKSCKKVFEQLQKLIGVKNELESGLSWSIYHRFQDDSSQHHLSMTEKVESNSKIAVAFEVMDECFRPFIDHRTGVNLIHNVVYNCGSNINRISYSGFYTFVLERGDEITAVASVRIHGIRLAEMPFIGTRHMYRHQGMCRQLLNGIESALYSLGVKKLTIPAISELVATWTGSFGFKHLSSSEREEIKSTNVIVFNGTGLLHKPITAKSPIREIPIPAKADNPNEYGKKVVNVIVCNKPETNSKQEAGFKKEDVMENSATNLPVAAIKMIPDLNASVDPDNKAATVGEFWEMDT